MLCCGFVFVSSGSGLGVCPELGMKNGLNQSRFHRDKIYHSLQNSCNQVNQLSNLCVYE